MFGPLTYLLWLALFIGFPILILLRWQPLLWAQRRALGWLVLGSLLLGWAWDALSIQWNIWHYHPDHIVGVWWAGLPLEEWLWIVGVSAMFGMLTIVLKERAG